MVVSAAAEQLSGSSKCIESAVNLSGNMGRVILPSRHLIFRRT